MVQEQDDGLSLSLRNSLPVGWLAVAACMGGRGLDSPPSGPVLPELRLVTTASFPLAITERVTGGLWFDSTRVLYWAPSGTWLLDISRGARQAVCQRPLTGVSGGGPIGGVVHLFDTASHSIVKVRSPGDCRWTATPATAYGSHSAAIAPTAHGWLSVIGGGVETVRLTLRPNELTDREPRTVDIPLQMAGTSDLPWLFLTPTASGAFLGSRRWPFAWVLFDHLARPIVRSNIGSTMLVPELQKTRDSSGGAPNWHALPPLDLERGFLRVLVNIRNDERILQVFDPAGRLVRSRLLNGAIGFFAVDRVQRRLLGLRFAGGPELVVYSGRWSHPRNVHAEVRK